MRLPRVYLDHPLDPGSLVPLPEGPSRHLTGVLRLRPGEALRCFNGDGRDRDARLQSAGRRALIAVGEAGPPEPEPVLEIHLALGVSRGERMDFAIQKAVELGVAALQPLFTERSMVQLAPERRSRRREHWQGVLIGACEQSGRRRLPLLAEARDLADWLAEGAPPDTLLLDPRAPQALTELSAPGSRVTLLVGPEGGLSPRERDSAARAGVRGVRLGPRILRTETAPLAAIAVIQALWGDFRG